MTQTKTDKATAERERKARIKRAHEHLARIPETDRPAVIEAAEQKEAQARDAGSRRSHVAFVEDALVAWEVGGAAIAAAETGKPLDRDQLAAMVDRVSLDIRGADGDAELRADILAGLDGHGLAPGQNRERALAMRAEGLTVAEIADRLHLDPHTARDLVGDNKRGTGKPASQVKAPGAGRQPRKPRDVRDHKGERQEKCPACNTWRPAPVDAAGGYVKESDFRAGRADCRSCYNTRWLEGKRRRESARSA